MTADQDTQADIVASAPAYPYTQTQETAISATAFVAWPAGLFVAQPGSNLRGSIGQHRQMIDGEQQDPQPSGGFVDLSTRMEWGGTDADTMEAWLDAVGLARFTTGAVLWMTGPVYGAWLATPEVKRDGQHLSAEIEVRLWQ